MNILYLYKEIMNFILRICVPSTLHMVVQYTEILTVLLKLTPNISKQPHFMIRFTILSEMRVYINKIREIYYSIDSR